eukprot:CAMPEP_0181059928 /NCGR_PEP_ID=MMETSP1070-20121207/21668_1 /TAXON_ID=265543 /ORGANISM="Minutocellus polymorphus, Strain NH13" /LENGTH=59 /DNA_ID=CAMNT_0023139687 /DNA_START=9 /DNA_END=185 /DNA_ORIENTATION=-
MKMTILLLSIAPLHPHRLTMSMVTDVERWKWPATSSRPAVAPSGVGGPLALPRKKGEVS